MPNYVHSPSHINEIHLQVLCAVESSLGRTQFQLVQVLGISLGKTHYCMKALIDKRPAKMGSLNHK